MAKQQIRISEQVQIGAQSPTALNVLIGANSESQYEYELKKINILEDSDFPIAILTDLSLGLIKNRNALWREIVATGRFIAGTVPVYQAIDSKGIIHKSKLLEMIEDQAQSGVKLMTIHPTPDYDLIQMSKSRRVPITSRGGGCVCTDLISSHRIGNVYMQILDQIIHIALKYCVILSIGASFRSANIYDGADETYYCKLSRQLEIAAYCKKRGVSVIVETPGHVSPQNILKICDYLQKNCSFPIMPLGPFPTDCAFQQDDVAAVIGAALMGTHNCADILSVVTSEEHSGGIPTIESLISAIQKYMVVKHVIDIYKLDDTNSDDSISLQRSKHKSCLMSESDNCNRCGNLCPLKLPIR